MKLQFIASVTQNFNVWEFSRVAFFGFGVLLQFLIKCSSYIRRKSYRELRAPCIDFINDAMEFVRIRVRGKLTNISSMYCIQCIEPLFIICRRIGNSST
ncbi:hypothetical protein ATY29_26615 [Rhizobium hidalgonense]|nr:hypothetical protein ATY29_26615 [Rhizobium hidalgonense]